MFTLLLFDKALIIVSLDISIMIPWFHVAPIGFVTSLQDGRVQLFLEAHFLPPGYLGHSAHTPGPFSMSLH